MLRKLIPPETESSFLGVFSAAALRIVKWKPLTWRTEWRTAGRGAAKISSANYLSFLAENPTKRIDLHSNESSPRTGHGSFVVVGKSYRAVGISADIIKINSVYKPIKSKEYQMRDREHLIMKDGEWLKPDLTNGKYDSWHIRRVQEWIYWNAVRPRVNVGRPPGLS